jgi:hypothetical protein
MAKSNTKSLEAQELDVIDIGLTPEGYEGVSPDYKPEGFASKEAFLDNMRTEHRLDLEYDRDNREAAIDDKKFSAGEQWDPIVLEQRKGLPCLVINSIPQFTAQLVGDWRESRKAIKVVPANDEDTDVASVRGDLIRSIELQSRASRVYDSAFESLIQCGDGAFRVAVEYARDDVFDQDIFIRPIEDALSVVWDRFSVDPTGRDARHVFVDDRIPKAEFNRKYPKVQISELEVGSAFEQLQIDGWIEQDSYRVTEYWRLIQRQRLMVMFENGKVFALDAENMEELVAANGAPIKSRVGWCTYAQMHLVTGFDILEGPFEYKINRVPIVRMSGRVVNVGGRRVRYGLVRFMKDPVRLKNFWRSIAAEQLGYAPKAQWIAPESAVEGREDKFRKAHLSRDPLLVYNDGAEAPPQRIEPPVPQAALLNEAQVNAQDMKDVTGIHDASLGVKSNETSGRAIQARQREGDIASLTFYDNGNESLLEGGDIINQLIPQIYDGTRVVRTIGEDETQKFVRINDPMDPRAVDLSVGMFDVALSTGTSYTTRRVEAAQAMMDAIQVWPNLMTVAGDLVAKAQDWPGADKLAERLKKTIPPQFLEEGEEGGGVPPEVLQELQMQMQALQQENEQLKTDKTIEFEKLEVDKYNAQTQRIKALSDHEVDMNQMEQDAIKTILDGSVKLDEMELKKDDIEAKHELAGKKQESDAALRAEQAKAKMAAPSTPKAKSTPTSGNKSQ